jgi:uncharacterized membrane protein YgcG
MTERIVEMGRMIRQAVLLALLATVALSSAMGTPVSAQDASSFPGLTPGQRVYDETGVSLSADQVIDLNTQIDVLAGSGADVIVFVRSLDATPEETLDQVEALQQAWVAVTGANEDTAVAILINRNPDDVHDARAGIYVGSTYDDGNVPGDEQRDIVEETLIPPLRDGDVFSSLMGGLARLDSSIRNGPPQNAFERWSSDAGTSWLPWTGLALAIPGGAAAISAFRRRQTTTRSSMPPTTDRPGDLEPAIAGALVSGGPQATAIPATLLSLAERGALVIEPESDGGMLAKPKVQVRLLDESRATSELDRVLWSALAAKADGDLVSSKDLQRVGGDSDLFKQPIDASLRAAGWIDGDARRQRGRLMVIGILAAGLAIFGFVVAAVGAAWMMLIGIVPLLVVDIAAFWMAAVYPGLTRKGQEAALPWHAYRQGLKRAAKDRTVAFDLDRVFVDAVALNLGNDFDDRLKEAAEEGVTLRAFRDQSGQMAAMSSGGAFPYWIAYSSVFASSSGTAASAATVSGGGAGGGGGAAGST